ncbi:MAG: aquaporin [Planctomycetes bacterium]|nr:aquaporin [Planctomycetota bacterium]
MKQAGHLARECAAELIGTYILVFFGTGAVHVAVLTGGLVGLWQVAVVWGIAVSLAIYATSAASGAHVNPAMTLAFVVWRGFPVRRAAFYVASQLAGAIAAAATLHAIFHGLIGQFEAAKALVRGQPGSELSGMLYGEYFPNPALLGTTRAAFQGVSYLQAMLAEGIGTAFLAFFVFAVTDVQNPKRPLETFSALFIGLAVAIVISVVAPLTQAGLNPARDFGPRLFACLAGWGAIAIPGPRGGFFSVYVLAPCLGALVGSAVYVLAIAPGLAVAPQAQEEAPQERVE